MRSTQLILFPQSHEGRYSSTAIVDQSQYVANHHFIFSSGDGAALQVLNIGLGSSSGFGLDANDYLAAVHQISTGNFLVPIGNWELFHSSNVTAPSVSGSKLTLTSTSTNIFSDGLSGAAQRITNLTVGFDYDLTIKVDQIPTNPFILEVNVVSPANTSNLFILNNTIQTVGIHTILYTPSSSAEDIILTFRSTDNEIIKIDKVTISETIDFSNVTFENLEDGQVICDIFNDEAIPVNLSVDEFKNTIEQTKSYSKDFMLPATGRNNKIFNEIFEITRSSQTDDFVFNTTIFNPYIKTKAVLKNDGYTILDGFLKLNDIIKKDDQTIYNVNLFTNTLSLKDKLENQTIAHLNFDELEHEYNKDNIVNSFTGVLQLDNPLPLDSFAGTAGATTTDVLKYPFCDWTGSLVNNQNNIRLINLEQAFRPFLKIKYLVDKIFAQTDFTFSSDFFNTEQFKRLYMDFNWGEGAFAIDRSGRDEVVNFNQQDFFPTSSFQAYNFDSINTNASNSFFNLTSNRFVNTVANLNVHIRYVIRLENDSNFKKDGRFRIAHYSATNVLKAVINKKIFSIAGTFSSTQLNEKDIRGSAELNLAVGDYIELQVKAADSNTIRQRVNPAPFNSAFFQSNVTFTYSSTGQTLQNLLTKKRGETKLFDILNDLRKMFNLVFLEDKENPFNIIIEPYDKIFIDNADTTTIDAKEHNWTDKLDDSEHVLRPIQNLDMSTRFSYKKDDNDFSLSTYENFTNQYYGEKIVLNERYNLLKTKKDIELEVFAPTFMKPLMESVDTEFTVPSIFAQKGETSTDFENEARILYDIGVVNLPSSTYSSLAQNNTSFFNAFTQFLQFSHTTNVPADESIDFNFGGAMLVSSMGAAPIDNLFNTYWFRYFDELYHPDTRTLTVKINLTPSDITNFNFYDRVIIKNRDFRVNKIEYKQDELATVELILLP